MNPSRLIRRITLPVAVLLLLPCGAGAQVAGLGGFVIASTGGARVPGVLVVVDTGERVMTDADGAYALTDLSPGPHRLALVAPGCQITFASLELRPGEHRTLGFEIVFDPAAAEAARHRRSPGGKVMTAPEIEALHVQTLADVLARMAPGFVGAPPSQPGQEARVRGRRSVSARSDVAPALIVDGVRLGTLETEQLSGIHPSDVAWIEVFRGASGGWEVGTGGSGGLVRIQTKRGRRMDMPYVEPERCEIPGWKS
ncbi:MAG: TonB-dependent receptor [Gemmatimonadetes bacterium]|nr:TonB-dependent receptor [Gemmatimonadota bacterium]